MSAVSRIAVTTTTAIAITAIPSMRPIRSTSRCSGVLCASTRPSRRATLPISVAIPVAVTTARPRPRATAVPLKTMFTRSPSADLAATASTSFRTASLSPVSDASATVSDAASTSRPSAATASPSASSSTSPGTTSAAGIRSSRAVAHDPGRRRRHPLQRRHRLLGPRLLHVAEHGVGEDDRRDHDRVERRLLPTLQHPRHQRDHDGGKQQVDQRIGELAEDLPPCRHRPGRLQRVRPEPRQPLCRLRRAQSPARVSAQRSGDLVRPATPRLDRASLNHARIGLDLRRHADVTDPRVAEAARSRYPR